MKKRIVMKRKYFFVLVFVLIFNSIIFADVYENLEKAQNLYPQNPYKAIEIFQGIIKDENANSEILLECAKAFLKYGNAKDALQIISNEKFSNLENTKINIQEFNYVKALSLLGNGKEKDALDLFGLITDKNYLGFADYFSALIYFRNENYNEAYEKYLSAEKNLLNVNYAQQANYQSALCAMYEYHLTKELAWLDKGIEKTICAVNVLTEKNGKIDALKLLSEMYIEKKDFETCEKTLLPYSRTDDKIGKVALFQLAVMYGNAGNVLKADETWNVYINRYKTDKEIDEAIFLHGELMYNFENWEQCINIFYDFKNNYIKSSLYDNAYFYLCDSLYKNDEKNRSLLLSLDFIKKYPESNFKFQVMMNCVNIYIEKEDYKNALIYVEKIISDFPEQVDSYDLRNTQKNLIKVLGE